MKVIMLPRVLGFSLLVAIAASPAQGEPAKLAAPVAAPAAAAPAATESAAAATVAPPKRTKVSCTQYRANAEKQAKHSTFNLKLKPGAWGSIPAPLRKLPSRSKLCGADGMGQAVIASPLFGKDLESYYTPLFTKIGFKPLACKVADGRTQCTCKRGRDIGILVTDQDSEAFVLALMNRSPRPAVQSPH
jgi:hypothetical protein